MTERPDSISKSLSDQDAAASERLLDLQIQQHERHCKSQSQLSRAVSWAASLIWSKDQESLDSLKKLRSEIEISKHTDSAPYTKDLVGRIAKAVKFDQDSIGWHREVAHYGAGFLKTAAMFLPRTAGRVATIVSFGFDQMKSGDSVNVQLADGGIGATKGLLMNQTFAVLGPRCANLGAASKGFWMGFCSRTLEVGLSRSTWTDQNSNTFTLSTGTSRWMNAMINPSAIATDIATFTLAHTVTKGMNNFTNGLVDKSPLISTLVSGASFGISNGALTEVQRQHVQGEELSLAKIAGRALLQGGFDGIAAIPGGIASDAIFRSEMKSLCQSRVERMHHKSKEVEALADSAKLFMPAQVLALEAVSGHFESAPKSSNSGHRPRRSFDSSTMTEWKDRENSWVKLSPAERLSLVKALRKVPEGSRLALWQQAISDSEQSVRFAAAQALSHLPGASRLKAWREAAHSQDHFVRILALAHIGDLKAKERYSAWSHALESGSVLAAPKADTASKPGKASCSSSKLELLDSELQALLLQSPDKHLVSAISTLPDHQMRAWQKAFSDTRTAVASAENILVVPEPERSAAWNAAWRRHTRWNPNSHEINRTVDSLVAQIAFLPAVDRPAAWQQTVTTRIDVTGKALARALESLPGNNKLDAWRQLLTPSHGSGRGAILAISGLPDSQRSLAWNEAAQSLGQEHVLSLSEAIKHLPAPERANALRHVLQHTNLIDVAQLLSPPRAEDIPCFVETVLSHGQMPLRHCLLKELPLGDLLSVPIVNRGPILKLAFEKACLGSDLDVAAVRDWWSHLSDPEFAGNGPMPTPVKRYLLDNLDRAALAKLLFTEVDGSGLLAGKIAAKHPEVLNSLGRTVNQLGKDGQMQAIVPLLDHWLSTGNLHETTRLVLELHRPLPAEERSAIPDLLHTLALSLGKPERLSYCALLSNQVCESPAATNEVNRLLLLQTGIKLAHSDPDTFGRFAKKLESALQDDAKSYIWRLATARMVASLERTGELAKGKVQLPNLRMPAVKEVTEQQASQLRLDTEAALHGNIELSKLLGKGELGRIFPSIFGNHTEGGIAGRPQHGGHEFALDEHIMRVVRNIRNHPDFATLTRNDQTNLLWAGLLHDVGKQACIRDFDHEWASGNVGWGVLSTLRYPPQRIQRIVDLVTGHRDVSFTPNARTSLKLADPDFLDNLAMRYRHPAALQQIRILNEADIRAVDNCASLWTPKVRAELEATTARLQDRVRQLNQHLVPVLTTELPRRFGVFPLVDDYALLIHATPHLRDTFWRQLTVIESPEFSISASLVTSNHKHTYRDDANFFAVVAGPFEKISQAYRENLSTGNSTTWREHVELSKRWLHHRRAKEFAEQLDSRLRQLGMGNTRMYLSALAEARTRLADFDSIHDVETRAKHTPLLRSAVKTILSSFIKDEVGVPLTEHNEIKLNNPIIVGLAIMRRGRKLFFDNITSDFKPSTYAQEGPPPMWLSTSQDKKTCPLIVPSEIWQEAHRRNLPIVILDP